MEEKILYQDDNILVSTTRIATKRPRKTYAVRQITTVSLKTERPFPLFAASMGCVTYIVVFAVLAAILANLGEGALGIGVLIAVFPGWMIFRLFTRRENSTYFITLTTTAGETQIFQSQDKTYSATILNHIERAIAT
jgi:hypothetical protein